MGRGVHVPNVMNFTKKPMPFREGSHAFPNDIGNLKKSGFWISDFGFRI
jgi:hypothetical protein